MYHNPIQPFLIFQGLALKDVKAKKVVACVEMKIAKSHSRIWASRYRTVRVYYIMDIVNVLGQGKDVEVLQPLSLREDMKQMILEAMGRYKE